MRRGLLAGKLYVDGCGKVEHLGCVFFSKYLLSAISKSQLMDLPGKDVIAHTNSPALTVGSDSEDRPYQTGKAILGLPKAGSFLLPDDSYFVIGVWIVWLEFRASLCSFNTLLFGTC